MSLKSSTAGATSQVPTARVRGPKRKISEEAWFDAAVELIAIGGVDAVRVEAMALKLGVTKGTFYVRFDSRDRFLDALLDHWRRVSTSLVISELNVIEETPLERLERVFTISTSEVARGRARVELALRSWAYYDERPARVLKEMDEHKLMYFQSVAAANGIPSAEAEVRAFLIYSYLISDAILPGDRDGIRARCRAFLASGTEWESARTS